VGLAAFGHLRWGQRPSAGRVGARDLPGPQRRGTGGTRLLRGQQGEGEVLGGGGAAFGGFFEGGVAAMEGVLGLASVEDLLDG